MNKKVIEALVEEDVGTKKLVYEYSEQNKQMVSDFVKQQNEVGNPCAYYACSDADNAHITLIQPDPELTEDELALLAQLNCSKTMRTLIDHVKTIKGILIFFCVLTCVSLITALALTLSQ